MIIVNFSTPQYIKGQKRLAASIPESYRKLMFTDYNTIGSPTHSESPYEFKLHSMKAAREIDPIVLWCDASLYCVGHLSIIENIIKTEGFFGEESGHYCSAWCNDFAKSYHKLTPEESIQGPGGLIMYSAGLTGLDFNNPKAVEFFNRWMASAKAGCFRGDYSNHRHDMVNSSIIAQRMGLKFQKGGTYLSYIGSGYGTPSNTSIFYLQGL